MKRFIVSFALFIILVLGFSAINAQTIVWYENFNPPEVGWVIEGNWQFVETWTTYNLAFNWFPSTSDFDMSAITPEIELPETVGTLRLNHGLSPGQNSNEFFQITVLHGDEETVLWDYSGTEGHFEPHDMTFSLIPFAGETVRLRLRAYGASTQSTNWWVYNIYIHNSVNNDLVAEEIRGLSYANVDQEFYYTVKIKNMGINTQDNYQIRLVKEGNEVISFIPGMEIERGEEQEYILSHTFTEVDTTFLWGEVFLYGDELPDNNSTDILEVNVLPQGTSYVVIGDGTALSSSLPISSLTYNGISQSIYKAEEFSNEQGLITAIKYFGSAVSQSMERPLEIWMAETDNDNLSEGWLPFKDFTKVFDGEIYFCNNQEGVLVPLDYYFPYSQSSNLVVMIKTYQTSYPSFLPFYHFLATETGQSGRSLALSQQGPINPNILPETNYSSLIPNTGFYFQQNNVDIAALTINSQEIVSVNNEVLFEIKVKNAGFLPQDDFTVRVVNQEGDILSSVQVSGLLDSNETLIVSLSWIPQETGTKFVYGEVLLDGDQVNNNNRTKNKKIVIMEEGGVITSVGNDFSTYQHLPLNVRYNSSLSQTIYLDEDIDLTGYISSISYDYVFSTNFFDHEIRIWFAETEENDLSQSWISYFEFTEVFRGNVNFLNSFNNLVVYLDEPYFYSGGNLVVMVEQAYYQDTIYGLQQNFYTTVDSMQPNRSKYFNSYQPINVQNVLSNFGFVVDRVPNITFFFYNGGINCLEGYVYDSNNEPLENVQLSIQNTPYTSFTDAGGYFYFSNPIEGFVELIAQKHSYFDYLIYDLELQFDETVVLTIELEDLPLVNVTGTLVGSDFPDIGLENAFLELSGYDDYSTVSNEQGFFSFDGVYGEKSYLLSVTVDGYPNYTDEVFVGSEDLNLGNFIVNEATYPPVEVIAELSHDESYVEISWQPPQPAQRVDNRAFEGYKVYRLDCDFVEDPDSWIELAFTTETELIDTEWQTVSPGFYRYAVKSVYTNYVYSEPVFSNWVSKDMSFAVNIEIYTDTGDSAYGAIAVLTSQEPDPDGETLVYSESAGMGYPAVINFENILEGLYELEVYLSGYTSFTDHNFSVFEETLHIVELEEILYPPYNLQFVAGNNIVNLFWDIGPEENDHSNSTRGFSPQITLRENGLESRRALMGFNVYRDGELLNDELINSNYYTDLSVENGNEYNYYVTAQYTVNESESSNEIVVIPNPVQQAEIGLDDNFLISWYPLNFGQRNSLYQVIYMKEEINAAGLLTSISFQYNFDDFLLDKDVSVWVKETDQNNLINGWIPAGEMELVFDDTVNFLDGSGTLTLEFETPFFYTRQGNLLIMLNRPMEDISYSGMKYFYIADSDYQYRMRYVFSNLYEYDPYNPYGGHVESRVPNTVLEFSYSNLGSLSGYVYNEDHTPLENAEIIVNDGLMSTTTDDVGFYKFYFIPEGLNTLSVEAFGYNGQQHEITINENENSSMDFYLEPLETVALYGSVSGSDFPLQGLEGAVVSLEGYGTYNTTSDHTGFFNIDNIYVNQQYNLSVSHQFYSTYTVAIDVVDTDFNIGQIVLDELILPPNNVTAELSDDYELEVSWQPPDPYITRRQRQNTIGLVSLKRSKSLDRERDLDFYYIYRVIVGQEDNPSLWDEIGSTVQGETVFIDEDFFGLNTGFYRYAVKAVYTNDLFSEPVFSNIIEHNFYSQVTINVMTNSGVSPVGTYVNLTNHNENPDFVYSANSPGSGVLLFPQVHKGLYQVTATKPYFEDYIVTDVEFFDDSEFYIIILIEALNPVNDLSYAVENNNVLLEWSVPETKLMFNLEDKHLSLKSDKHLPLDSKYIGYNNLTRAPVFRTPLNYRIYRNDEVIAEEIIDLSYYDEDLPGGEYIYGVKVVYQTGESETEFTDSIKIVQTSESVLQYQTQLLQNFPNPFNPDTNVSYSLGEATFVSIEVFNLRGQKIRLLYQGLKNPGYHSLVWDGRDDNDNAVSSGVYYLRMKVEDETYLKKMLLVK